MLSYRHVATYFGDETSFVTNITDLRAFQAPSGYALYSVTHIGGGIAAYRLTSADRPIEMISARAYGPQLSYLDRPSAALVDLAGQTAIFGTGLSNALGSGIALDAAGDLQGGGVRLTGPGGLASDVILLGSFSTPLGEFIYSVRDGKTFFETWRVSGDGSVTNVARADLPWGAGIQGTQIDDMEVVSMGDRTFMLSASAQGNYVSVQMIYGNGTLGAAQTLWSDRGLGLNAPSHIASVTFSGVTYLIVASSLSSSLTTMRVTYAGSLEPVDHIIDELGTRFHGASSLETVMMDGRAFIFVGGADDGISVFTIMPDGHLLHLATLADTDDRAMADISAISAIVIDGRIAVFVSSRTERGITQFVFEPGSIGSTGTVGGGRVTGSSSSDMLRAGAGTTAIIGGDGDDILISGANPVNLTGGNGSDLFVVTPVDGRINIMDFEQGVDRLDLSNLGMIRSMLQLVFRPQSDGIKIFFADTVIWIRTRDGSGMQANYFNNSLFPNAHYDPPNMRTNITGTTRNDVLYAGKYGSNLYGLTGSDVLQGGVMDDIMLGGPGDDTLYGGDGNDQLSGDDGNDLLRGGNGDDRLRGGNAADLLYGGAGNDSLYGDAGNDTIYGESGDDYILDMLGNNAIWGGLGNDWITTGSGNDMIFGEAGRDTIFGGVGNDRIWGGPDDDSLNGGAGNDIIYGGTGNDVLEGSDGNDVLVGNEGNDILWGNTGNDILNGGYGNDTLYGGPGNDTLRGMDGDDLLMAGAGNDHLHGYAGDDILRGEDGDDTLLGGLGNDTLAGGTGHDQIYGGDGADQIFGEDGNDSLWGDAGNDTIWGQNGNDIIYGGDGDDLLMGHVGHDTLFGQIGNDSLWGGEGNDRLEGLIGDDLMMGEGGNDLLLGGYGRDTLYGGSGWDTLWGGNGDDLIFGGDNGDWIDGGVGNDMLDGGPGMDSLQDYFGNNLLYGGEGNDQLSTGAGNDTLEGGSGSDTMRGGMGADVFVFSNPADYDGSKDVMLDFARGSDLIDMRGLGLSYIGTEAFSGAGQIRSFWTAQTGRMIEIDLDGDGRAELSIALGSIGALSESDFLL